MKTLLDWKHVSKAIENWTGVRITPWELDSIPEDWMDAILTLDVEVPRKAEIINKAKGIK